MIDHTHTCTLTRSLTHIHSLTHSLTHPLPPPLHSHAFTLTHTLTHPCHTYMCSNQSTDLNGRKKLTLWGISENKLVPFQRSERKSTFNFFFLNLVINVLHRWVSGWWTSPQQVVWAMRDGSMPQTSIAPTTPSRDCVTLSGVVSGAGLVTSSGYVDVFIFFFFSSCIACEEICLLTVNFNEIFYKHLPDGCRCLGFVVSFVLWASLWVLFCGCLCEFCFVLLFWSTLSLVL